MNEQLQLALAEILGRTIDGIDASVEFMQAELPDVISQLLLWHSVKGAIYFIVGVLMIAAWLTFIFKVYKSRPENGKGNAFWDEAWGKGPNEFNFGWGISLSVASVAITHAGLCMMAHIVDTIQIMFAPKLWLIEYAANLAK